MNPGEDFRLECEKRIELNPQTESLVKASKLFAEETIRSGYSYNFSWMGRPIIQYPQDMIAMQEIIWEVKPDLIIETGIAHGGSLIYYASLLELIGDGEILGIDIDIRDHNRKEIENHKMSKRIKMLQGSSIGEDIVEQVKKISAGHDKILVVLDSNHTHDHVLKELQYYSPLVSLNSYIVVFDTIVEDLPEESFPVKRPWGVGDNPKTALIEFLKTNSDFVIDAKVDHKLMISVAPNGYLKRIK